MSARLVPAGLEPASAQDRAALRLELDERNVEALRLAAVIGYTLVPGFWLLDLVVLPQHALLLGLLRIALAVYAAVLHGLVRWRHDWCLRHATPLTQSLALSVAWTVYLMVFLHSGYASPYYAGVTLVLLTVGFLFDWPVRPTLVFHALVLVPYLAPGALGLVPLDPLPLFATHVVFLVSAISIVFASQVFRLRLVERAFFANRALKETSSSLEQALGRLKELDRAKSEFFQNITHELRTPLTLILSPVRSLLDDAGLADRPEAREALSAVWRNGLSLLRLVNDLLDLAAADERFLRLRLKRDPLGSLLQLIVERAEALATRKGITLALDLGPDPDDLYVDVDRMERVVLNLLGNAMKFTGDGGRVVLRRRVEAQDVLIEVEDTGIGIPEEALQAIFERFHQADGSVTRRFGGTGIGLAFARDIVRLHGGRIDVDSEVRRGSTFTVRLPRGNGHVPPEMLERRVEDAHPAFGRRAEDQIDLDLDWTRSLERCEEYRFQGVIDPEVAPTATRAPGTAGAVVLVVEDNPDMARVLEVELSGEHRVVVARDGVVGLDLALRLRPDVVVTDYMMPEMDGLTMLRRLRANPAAAGIPVVMLTARAGVRDRLDARDSGADTYLPKPFDPRELRAVVRQLLGRQARQAHAMQRAEARGLEIVTAGLAHEVHNPLGNLKNAYVLIIEETGRLLATLGDSDADGKDTQLAPSRARIDRMAEVARRSITRIEEVIGQVRRYAREGYPSEPVRLDLNAAVRDVVDVLVGGSMARVVVDLDLAAGEVPVCAVADELNLVVRNLVRNAMDAVGETGRVRVHTASGGAGAHLVVSDDGPGIAREHLSRIFSPFFTTKEPGAGMGLGLAITWNVIERAGGSVEVDSEPGRGATFSVWLPRPPEPAPVDPSA